MKYRACIPSARFDPFERRLFEDGRPTGREVNEASWASLGKGKRRAGYEKKRERKERGRNGYKRDKGRSCNTHTWRASTTCPGLTPSPTGVMRCSSTCIRRSVGRWPSPRVELKNSLTKPGGLVFRATEFQRDLRALDLLFFFFFFFPPLCFLSKILHGFIREKFGVVNGKLMARIFSVM